MKMVSFLILFLCALLLPLPAHSSPSYSSDQHALLSFKHSLSSANSLSDWSHNVSACNWTSVTCSHRRQRVVSLNLTGVSLTASSISPFLSNLSFLRILDLSDNSFHGHIPPQLGSLFRLRILQLSYNHLSGTIPSQLGLLPNLKKLLLGYNQLTGTIPSSLGNQSSLNLEQFGLGGNELKGTIPSSIGNLSSLNGLDFADNKLHGRIPVELGMLTQLNWLTLWRNQLTGHIPSSLSNCTLLQVLDLSKNQLSGTVPSEFGKLLHFQRLNLWGNHLVSGSSGLSILTTLTNCSYLEDINFAENYLTGILPSSVSQLSKVLSKLLLAKNKIEGKIPSGIGNLTRLTALDLQDNRFNGTIPSTLSQLPNLERLFMDQNNLCGTISENFGQAKRLGMLSLSENMLSEKIPESLGNLPQLRDLYLNHNQLSGEIPASLGRCITLEVVDLSYNKLTGSIPPEVAGLPNLQFYFDLSNNLLKGSLLAMSKMVMVQAIDVSFNQFSGEIPAELSSCINLQYLNLSWNSFDGPIPASLTHLKNLQVIDLSKNNLSSSIPMAFKDMKMLQHINFSSNRLTGEVPREGVFATIDESAIMGNIGLCGTWIHLQPCSHSKHEQFSVSKKVMIPLVIGISVFIMSILLLLYSYRKRHTSQKTLTLNVAPTIISYEELVEATGGFMETNLLGVGNFGSVYKGILKNGTNIAVKVLNLQDEIVHQSFVKECSVLKRVKHRNMIKIISTCSNLNFKALVLPFMSNGNLEKWLYPQGEEECRLNLNDRLRIAIEIAHGITYLHHHCFVQVIHCDLKPNNVLLGDDMTPYITDFGIAKLLFGNSMDSLTSTNALKGSIGYIAPEYGMGGSISAKGDVYSYGILLLELLIRRRPTNGMFVEGTNLQNWVGMKFPDKIIEVVDNNLLRDTNELERSMVLACLTQCMQVAL
ncbi:hypothetical protein KI387_001054, partial [Taxus chinensis]